MAQIRPKKSKAPSKKLDWYKVGGGVLALWGIANTTLSITRYGWENGFYWWFCNLALLGLAGGVWFKHRGWLTGFVSIALFTQVFWLIDNQYRLFTGRNLFGLAEFMFQPGLPIGEFILSHYHYVTIPIALVALYFLPKEKSNALRIIAVFNPLALAISYFAFPKIQNINCMHEPCIPTLQSWAGPSYSIFFFLFLFLTHLLVGYLLERGFQKVKVTKIRKRRVALAFQGFLVLACAMTVWDVRYKLSLPSFTCLEGDESKGVKIECGYSLDFSPGVMVFNYRLKNQTEIPRACRTSLETGERTFLLDGNIQIAERGTVKPQVLVPYPHINTAAKLRIDCEHPERETATE